MENVKWRAGSKDVDVKVGRRGECADVNADAACLLGADKVAGILPCTLYVYIHEYRLEHGEREREGRENHCGMMSSACGQEGELALTSTMSS